MLLKTAAFLTSLFVETINIVGLIYMLTKSLEGALNHLNYV